MMGVLFATGRGTIGPICKDNSAVKRSASVNCR